MCLCSDKVGKNGPIESWRMGDFFLFFPQILMRIKEEESVWWLNKKFVLFFRISFAFQMLALILWLVAVCIISKTIAVGAQFLLLSGLSQVMSCTLIAFIPEMIIHLPGTFLSL